MFERLKRTPPLPYHLGFMIGLTSGVPQSITFSVFTCDHVLNF
jgi:hypothetical protein